MTAPAPSGPARWRPNMVWLIGLGLVAVLVLANAHLVYVAFSSQPDCVSHLNVPDGSDQLRAAKSSC